jgi:Holliday junction DNA helicase RuvA
VYDHFQGLVVRKDPTRVVLRVGGTGYDLRVSLHSGERIREGAEVLVYVHMHVTDGVPTLLGFSTRMERELCRKLLSVAGVGPSIALAVLSTDAPERVAAAIERGEAGALRKVKGIGPKTAQRICLELKDSLQVLALVSEKGVTIERDREADDAVAALVTLGFADRDARRRVENLRAGRPKADAGELTRLALRDSAARAGEAEEQ